MSGSSGAESDASWIDVAASRAQPGSACTSSACAAHASSSPSQSLLLPPAAARLVAATTLSTSDCDTLTRAAAVAMREAANARDELHAYSAHVERAYAEFSATIDDLLAQLATPSLDADDAHVADAAFACKDSSPARSCTDDAESATGAQDSTSPTGGEAVVGGRSFPVDESWWRADSGGSASNVLTDARALKRGIITASCAQPKLQVRAVPLDVLRQAVQEQAMRCWGPLLSRQQLGAPRKVGNLQRAAELAGAPGALQWPPPRVAGTAVDATYVRRALRAEHGERVALRRLLVAEHERMHAANAALELERTVNELREHLHGMLAWSEAAYNAGHACAGGARSLLLAAAASARARDVMRVGGSCGPRVATLHVRGRRAQASALTRSGALGAAAARTAFPRVESSRDGGVSVQTLHLLHCVLQACSWSIQRAMVALQWVWEWLVCLCSSGTADRGVRRVAAAARVM